MKARTALMVAAFATGLAACASAPERKVLINIPAVSPVAVERFRQITVEDFREVEAVPDVSIGRRTAEYLEAELRGAFKGSVGHAAPAAPQAEGLVLSGTVGLSQQAQKALREKDIPKDGPFGLANRGLAERKRFTLTFEYSLVDAATRRPVLTGSGKATHTYGDVQQSAEFALTDLLPMVKANLFPALFGRVTAGERYLLLR